MYTEHSVKKCPIIWNLFICILVLTFCAVSVLSDSEQSSSVAFSSSGCLRKHFMPRSLDLAENSRQCLHSPTLEHARPHKLWLANECTRTHITQQAKVEYTTRTHNKQKWIRHTQHITHNTQHTTHNTQNTEHNKQKLQKTSIFQMSCMD